MGSFEVEEIMGMDGEGMIEGSDEQLAVLKHWRGKWEIGYTGERKEEQMNEGEQ